MSNKDESATKRTQWMRIILFMKAKGTPRVRQFSKNSNPASFLIGFCTDEVQPGPNGLHFDTLLPSRLNQLYRRRSAVDEAIAALARLKSI
jgi:hypothetical protein